MKRPFLLLLLVPVLLVGAAFWTKGWRMDYGKPSAQFEAADLAAKGAAFVGKKITVKGVVAKVEVADGEPAWVELEGGIRCRFGDFRAMAGAMEPGEVALVDGFLERCEEGGIVLDPAVSRDPKAPFAPR